VTLDAPQLTILVILGLAIGSFLNVCIHRIPRGQSLAHPGSRCPTCGYALRWYDNVPVVSYAALGGRCRKCRAPISVRYPLVEVATMCLFVLYGTLLGWTPLLVPRLFFACAMVVLFAIDLEHHLLPDVITLPGIVLGLVSSAVLPPGLRDALIGAVAGGGVLWVVGEAYYRYSGQEGMGGGDVKMLAMIGAFLGWELMLLTLVLSSLVGSFVGLFLILSKRGGLKYALPYGTFLAFGGLVASLVGDRILGWYLSFY
jgi:leader peptidase (prepilin peptidase) / N-methyltransferase